MTWGCPTAQPARAAGDASRRTTPARRAIRPPCSAPCATSLATCGYEIDELELSRERTECCGFGGLMLYANPEMGDVVADRRVAESDADFVAYCAMCRDRFAARGKRDGPRPRPPVRRRLRRARASRRGPVLTQRAGQRAALKQRLLADVWGEPAPVPDWREALLVSPGGGGPPGAAVHPPRGSLAGRRRSEGDRPPLRRALDRTPARVTPARRRHLLGRVRAGGRALPRPRGLQSPHGVQAAAVAAGRVPPSTRTAGSGGALSATTRSSLAPSRSPTWSPVSP